jgi:MerR family transcriptional regulator, copper efflux regulator
MDPSEPTRPSDTAHAAPHGTAAPRATGTARASETTRATGTARASESARITRTAQRLGISPRMLRYRESLGLLPAVRPSRRSRPTAPGARRHRRFTPTDHDAVALGLSIERRYDITPAALAFGLRVLADPRVRAEVAEFGARIGRIQPPPARALDFEQERALRLLRMGAPSRRN